MLEVFYTFGSDEAFPFGRDQYVKVIGKDMKDCNDTFRKHFPPRDEAGTLNCSDYYTRDWWEKLGHSFGDVEPVKTFVSDAAYGIRKKGFDGIWAYCPEKEALIFIQEGSGDNLDEADREEGFVDYIDYTSYDVDFIAGTIEDADGGMVMSRQYVQDRYGCLTDALPDVLDDMYGSCTLGAVILKERGDVA